MKNIWTELYDPKEGRKLRQIPSGGKCGQCGEWNGHKLDCDAVDMEQLARIAKEAQRAEEHARKTANRYWQSLQQYQGKLATLRHENNQLRRANEKAKALQAVNTELNDMLQFFFGQLQMHSPGNEKPSGEKTWTTK